MSHRELDYLLVAAREVELDHLQATIRVLPCVRTLVEVTRRFDRSLSGEDTTGPLDLIVQEDDSGVPSFFAAFAAAFRGFHARLEISRRSCRFIREALKHLPPNFGIVVDDPPGDDDAGERGLELHIRVGPSAGISIRRRRTRRREPDSVAIFDGAGRRRMATIRCSVPDGYCRVAETLRNLDVLD